MPGQRSHSRLGDGGGVFDGTVCPTAVAHGSGTNGQGGNAGGGGPTEAVVSSSYSVGSEEWVVVVGDHGVARVTRGGGDGVGEGNGHEAEAFPL